MSGVRPYSFETDYGPKERDINAVEDIDGHDGRQITSEDLSDENENRVGNTAWCSCNTCFLMPSVAEWLCCQEVDELGWKLQDLICITQHENFLAVCRNEDVLRTAVVLMTDGRRDPIREPITSRRVAPRRTWTGLPIK